MIEASTELQSSRTRLRREAHKGRYDKESLYKVLDANFICNLAFSHELQPYTMPTFFWREEDRVYWHGSSASRLMRACAGAPVCMNVHRMTGLVLARSAFEHTANFESVTILGVAVRVDDEQAKLAQLQRFMERIFPGRWPELRAMRPQELKATAVLSLSLAEASVKLRMGPSNEPEADLAHAVWAGEVPLVTRAGAPIPDAYCSAPLPDYLKRFQY